MKPRAIRYPVETEWFVCAVKAIDPNGVFRHALCISTPQGRFTYELREQTRAIDRTDKLCDGLITIFDNTEWYAQPTSVTFDEIALCNRSEKPLQTRDVEVRCIRSDRKSKRSQKAFEKWVKANPLTKAA